MKIVLGMLAILVLMTLTPSVFAISNYQPGFNHGVREAKCTSVGCREYIIQQGKGLGFLRRDFINRYVNGYCSIALPPTSKAAYAGLHVDGASFSCKEDPSSAKWISTARHSISGGIIILPYDVPAGGMKVVFNIVDNTSGTTTKQIAQVRYAGDMQYVIHSREVNSGYFHGDKVTMSVTMYVHSGKDHFGLGVPQPIFDKKTRI